MNEQKKLSKIKSSVFGRGLSLAKLTMNAGASLAGNKISNVFSSEEKKTENWNSFLKSQASSLSAELGQLKGSLMKAGQLMSIYGEHFLPPEANQFLKELQNDSPPVEWNIILTELNLHLGSEKLSLLEIIENPIGTASLGQVHKATIKATGEVIALKVQYPGVEKAINSDLKALRTIFNMMSFLPQGATSDLIFEEVRSMLTQETDYVQEALQTEQYSERLKGDSRYSIPKVYREFCSPKVLATSFESGIKPGEKIISALSFERRNRLAYNYMDLYLKEIFQWGTVQTDPHFGNYKIRLSADGQDKLVLLDFGATRTYSMDFLDPYRKMIKAIVTGDSVSLEKESIRLQFLQAEDSLELKNIYMDFCKMMAEPFQDLEYDWGTSDLPERITKKGFQMIQSFKLRTPPKELIFLDRKTGGVFIFLSKLKARINVRPLMLKYLENIPKDSRMDRVQT